MDAVFPIARDRLTFPELMDEGLSPHKVPTLLLGSFSDGNYYVDITSTIENKMNALAAHASQMADVVGTQNRMRDVSKLVGGKMGVNYGESFTKISLG